MRVVYVFFAVMGGCALAAATAIEIAVGQPAGVAWGIAAAPFYVAGLVGVLSGRTRAEVSAAVVGEPRLAAGGDPRFAAGDSQRASGQRVSAWLLATGALFLV